MVTKKIINLDYAAGKPVDSRVLDSMLPYMNRLYGNPSSLHSMGQEAKKALYQARKQVSELINAERPENIIFTSSATESNNLAIKGVANRNKEQGTKIIASNVEHISVINPIKYLTSAKTRIKGKVDAMDFIPINNPSTIINFSIPKENTLVSLKIYNSIGQEVGTLINQVVPAGNHEVQFDATGLPCGVYFYTLTAGNFVNSKKMIVLK